MSIELKVKGKTLSAEIRIIKKEEAKALRFARRLEKSKASSLKYQQEHLDQYGYLRDHRCGINGHTGLRMEARCVHLARCFLRGTPYNECEPVIYDPPNWDKISYNLKKYADHESLAQDLTRWKNEGIAKQINRRVTPKVKKVKDGAG